MLAHLAVVYIINMGCFISYRTSLFGIWVLRSEASTSTPAGAPRAGKYEIPSCGTHIRTHTDARTAFRPMPELSLPAPRKRQYVR